MSPENKIKLNLLRKKLDKIDTQLLKVVKKRISVVLKKIRKESLKKKIDPKITHKIWKNMIWSYIDFEKRNFKKK